MAAKSSGNIVKYVRKREWSTNPTYRHRFEPFSKRIARISIDPLRTVRRYDHTDADITTAESYFKTSLEQWNDLNTSEIFTSFSREVAPLCNSLTQILHFESDIVDLIVKYIERRDALSLEPLLSLLGHLAHDLGVRFEAHFSRSVALVTSLASKHPNVEVIEWSFNSLAWLFKYLSRLIVLDLRPTYDLLAPLLGKQSQKPFVTRFAAEAFSFLIRKAAISQRKDFKPLKVALRHIFSDLSEANGSKGSRLYHEGIMTLLAEAMKSTGRDVHSKATTILKCALDLANTNLLLEDTICGVLIAMIHHTDALTFEPLMQTVLDYIHGMIKVRNSRGLKYGARFISILAGVRKGSRVGKWKDVLDTLVELVSASAQLNETESSDVLPTVLSCAAVAMQYSPLENVFPIARTVMASISTCSSPHQFLLFCSLFADLGEERFKIFILPSLSKFISQHWRQSEDNLSILLPTLQRQSRLTMVDHSDDLLPCPRDWQEQIMASFAQLRSSIQTQSSKSEDIFMLSARCNTYLDLFKVFSFGADIQQQILASLQEIIQTSFEELRLGRKTSQFGTGQGLLFYIREVELTRLVDINLWPSLSRISSSHKSIIPFVESICEYFGRVQRDDCPYIALTDTIFDSLKDSLSFPSHALRERALTALQCLHTVLSNEPSTLLATALAVENMNMDLSTARQASMHVRKLASDYSSLPEDSWLRAIVPSYCFGLLTVNFAPIWDDVLSALGVMAAEKSSEAIIMKYALSYLDQQESAVFHVQETPKNEAQGHVLSPFECSNLLNIWRIESEHKKTIQASLIQMRSRYVETHSPASPCSENSRIQALRFLRNVPQVAEKYSRQIVPFLLDWGLKGEDEISPNETTLGNEAGSTSAKSLVWSRRERKELLKLFSAFTSPKSLYRSAEVYDCLLKLLTNGDVEIQKDALGALFTWRSPAILNYQENLSNLLDDARFRDEVAIFVQLDEEASSIQRAHRRELTPILLRLLYGRLVARQGIGKNRAMEGNRDMVLSAIADFPSEELGDFIMIALGPLKYMRDGKIRKDGYLPTQEEFLTTRKQLGVLNMIESMLRVLGAKLLPFVTELMEGVLYCTILASRKLVGTSSFALRDTYPETSNVSLLKSVRHAGLRCLNLAFTVYKDFTWDLYIPTILEELVEPRLSKFAIETAQSVSGLLRLFYSWSSSSTAVLFLGHNQGAVLDQIVSCLSVRSAKDDVKTYTIEIIRNIISIAEATEEPSASMSEKVKSVLLRPHLDSILLGISAMLRESPGRDLMELCVETLSRLSPFISSTTEARNMTEVSVFLLEQPTRRVSPKSKSNLLLVLHYFIPLSNLKENEGLIRRVLEVISSLFGFFKDQHSRENLAQVLCTFAQIQPSLQQVSEICKELNAFSTKRLDEPDFERRLKAFYCVCEDSSQIFSAEEWRPLIFNMLYFIKDNEELAIRQSAALALRRLLESASRQTNEQEKQEFELLLSTILLPAIRNGAREPSELVRSEYIGVMAHAVKLFPGWHEVSDMSSLLGEDENTSFFNRILDIQQRNRFGALQLLSSKARSGIIKNSNLSQFLIPLVEHFIFDAGEDENSYSLAAEARSTVGTIIEELEWPHFKAILRRYISYLKIKPDAEKNVVRLLGYVIDALKRASTKKGYTKRIQDRILFTFMEERDSQESSQKIPSKLSLTLPQQEKLASELIRDFLPTLQAYLHQKDESTVSLRVPIAVSVVKILNVLPFDQLANQLPAVLMDVCHILRSKAQEARDMTRKTLADICAELGPECIGFVITELRGALVRGFQLHVLSFTVHSILVSITPHLYPGDIDYCTSQIVTVVMDDIFGTIGQEKDAEDYVSKMKEIKSRKSYDTMELLARTTTIRSLPDLIRPVQSLLRERLTLKVLNKIEEVLRRISVGLIRNEAVQNQDLLILCHELIQDISKHDREMGKVSAKDDPRTKRYLINLKCSKYDTSGSTGIHEYKMTRFAFNLIQSLFHKNETICTKANIEGILPLIGDALLQNQGEVQVSALRLLSTIVKIPMEETDRDSGIYIAQAVRFIKSASSTNTELAQASLKLISAVLRDRPNVEVKETWITDLLKLLKPELVETDRQGVIFHFLRSVMDRKIVVPEVYEIADFVAHIMVTNQTKHARDLARGTYFQFLMEYPQGKDRFTNQLNFLVKNLDYPHEEGRRSVLEVVHLLAVKTGESFAQGIARAMFVPLVMVVINDEDNICREMAGAILKELFERSNDDQLQLFLGLMRTWLKQGMQPLLNRASLQCYEVYLDLGEIKSKKEVSVLRSELPRLLRSSEDSRNLEDWELKYAALKTFAKLVQISPETSFRKDSEDLWSEVKHSLNFPHTWVKNSAMKLISAYFEHFTRASTEDDLARVPLIGPFGLRLDAQGMRALAKGALNALNVPGIREELATQASRNLVFLGRCFGSNQITWCTIVGGDEANSEDEIDNVEWEMGSKSALQYLFERVSAIIRRESISTKAPALYSKTAALQLLSTLCIHLSSTLLVQYLPVILLPLSHLTDPSIPAPYSTDPEFVAAHKMLVSSSQELIILLQKRVGTMEFTSHFSKVREAVKERREERRAKRRIEILTQPEKTGREKRKKGEKKREKRKERSSEYRAARRGQ